jgi:UDP-N-acetylglucosamine 2-epimerase
VQKQHFPILLGTYPEAIKLFAVIKAESGITTTTVCATSQHRQMPDRSAALHMTAII